LRPVAGSGGLSELSREEDGGDQHEAQAPAVGL
jgi:hypothetical protein